MRTDDLSYPYFGLFVGTITSVDDPMNLGRVRVDTDQYADDAPEGLEPVWAVVARPAAGQMTGIYFTPKKGDQVIVGYITGDVEQPVVLGYAHSSADPPPAEGSADKQAIVTTIGSIVFDEKAGSITVTFKGPPTSSVKLDAKGVEISSDATVNVTAKGAISFTAPALVFAGYPSFGPPMIPGVSPPSTPIKMDFSDVGLAITTGTKEFCVNDHAVALKKFVTELYNVHTHASGSPPAQQWTPAGDATHAQISNCEDPP